MSINKDIRLYVKIKRKIPVLNENILHRSVLSKNKSSATNSVVHRTHLRTLAHENVDQNCLAGPSRDVPVDIQNVTLRKKKKTESRENIENVHVKTVIPGKSVQKGLTPASPFQPIEKKVKKSLNGPNSISNLEIVSSIATGVPLSLPTLDIATEQANHNCLPEIDPPNRHYTLAILKHLLRTEKKFNDPPEIRTKLRVSAIRWIVKLHLASGSESVIQHACRYLDKLLCSSGISETNTKLLAAACCWIAIKLNGSRATARRMARYLGRRFAESDLISTERFVLREINFETVVVPQDFVSYFSWCCGCEHYTEVEVAANFICICGVMLDKTLVTEYPSVVAAAAVMISLELLKKTMCIEQLQSCCIYKEAEKKATNLKSTRDKLNAAIREVHSSRQDYKENLDQSFKPSDYIPYNLLKKITPLKLFALMVLFLLFLIVRNYK